MMRFADFFSVFRRKPAEPPPIVSKPRPKGPITLALMHAAAPTTPSARLLMFVDPLNEAAMLFDITAPQRYGAWLAQCAHESDGFLTTTEYASGASYEGRVDLGNDEPGDGRKYRGHGLIQTTGKKNHRRAAEFFGIPFDQIVEWLQTPEGAAKSAGLYWHDHNLNALADAGQFDAITKAINGGYTGKADRDARYAAIRSELSGEG